MAYLSDRAYDPKKLADFQLFYEQHGDILSPEAKEDYQKLITLLTDDKYDVYKERHRKKRTEDIKRLFAPI